MPPVTCHMSCFTCNVSTVTCHLPHVTFFLYIYFFFMINKNGWAIWWEVTCVSNMRSRTCVTLLKLRMEMKTNFSFLRSIFGAFDLIPTLRDRPEDWLLANLHSHKAGTKYTGELPLYLADFFLSTTFGYAQPRWAAVNHSHSGYGHNAMKR